MKFHHENFDLIVIWKNSNWLKKPLEFIFSDENLYESLIKNVWWNFNRSHEWNIEIWHEQIINLESWYFKEKEENWINNIFYDYLDIEFQLSNDYKLSIESDYNTSWFLEDITKKDDEFNRYKLSYKLKEEDNKIYWFWWYVKFVIYKWEERYIFSPFFKTKNLEEDSDVQIMIDQIKEELFYSLFTNKNISLSSYKIKLQKDTNQQLWTFINIFQLLYKDLENSINDISENAKFINNLSTQVKKYNWWKINIDNRFINDVIKKWYFDKDTNSLNIYWKNIVQRKIVWEYNNVSNKIFIHLLQNLVSKLDSFLIVWKNKLNDNYLEEIKEKKDKISSKKASFINKYNLNINKLWNLNIDYQHLDSRYKKFVLNYFKLFFMLDFLNWEIMLANKSIDQIYEYWSLIKTRDILLNLLEAENDKKAIFSVKKNNDDLVFELWDNSKVEIKWNNWECSIIYKFQNTISSIWNDTKIPKNDLRIISAWVRPDIFINIKNNSEEKYIIMDGKYSTDSDWNIHKDRFENLYKYKSWIVKCTDLQFNEDLWEWEWDMENIIDEVVAIYPWKKEEKNSKLYKKSISSIWFGWLVMKPWEVSDIEEYFKGKV